MKIRISQYLNNLQIIETFYRFKYWKNIGSIGRKQIKAEPNVELKIRWKDLSLKTICEEEEWKAQFEPVREKFTKCLGLKKIIVDENDPDDDIDRMGMFRSETHNPYCKWVTNN